MTNLTTKPTRRTLLQLAGGVAAGAVAAPYLTGTARAATQITVADPGGPFGPAFRKAFYDPFEKATGNKVVNVAREAEPIELVPGPESYPHLTPAGVEPAHPVEPWIERRR